MLIHSMALKGTYFEKKKIICVNKKYYFEFKEIII